MAVHNTQGRNFPQRVEVRSVSMPTVGSTMITHQCSVRYLKTEIINCYNLSLNLFIPVWKSFCQFIKYYLHNTSTSVHPFLLMHQIIFLFRPRL